MERLIIDRDEVGKMKRVSLEHLVLTPEPLVKLQQSLSQVIAFRPASIEDLHLTLFHYGKPENLYSEVSQANPHLVFNGFLEGFINLLEHNLEFRSENITTTGDSIDIFGDANKPALVVTLKKSADLLRLRTNVMSKFNQFLKGCGIMDIESFMRGSSNLKYQIDYNPHLTLGFPVVGTQIPKVNVSDLQVILGNLQLVNVSRS